MSTAIKYYIYKRMFYIIGNSLASNWRRGHPVQLRGGRRGLRRPLSQQGPRQRRPALSKRYKEKLQDEMK